MALGVTTATGHLPLGPIIAAAIVSACLVVLIRLGLVLTVVCWLAVTAVLLVDRTLVTKPQVTN